MRQIKRLIIVGPGGSGKDFLRKRLEKKGFRHSVSHTSRPKREGETDGKDYHYVDSNFFENNKPLFYEIEIFNKWYYGTSLEEFDKSDLFVMTVKGVKSLNSEHRKESMVLYLNPPKDVIIERLKARKDADNVWRRMEADDRDFSGFKDYDIEIKNPDF